MHSISRPERSSRSRRSFVSHAQLALHHVSDTLLSKVVQPFGTGVPRMLELMLIIVGPAHSRKSGLGTLYLPSVHVDQWCHPKPHMAVSKQATVSSAKKSTDHDLDPSVALVPQSFIRFVPSSRLPSDPKQGVQTHMIPTLIPGYYSPWVVRTFTCSAMSG